MPTTPSPEAYRQEYYYQLALQRQQTDFDELMTRFPEGQYVPAVMEALHHTHAIASARDPSHILNPDAMREIRQTAPDIFAQISPVYQDFLAEKAGLK